MRRVDYSWGDEVIRFRVDPVPECDIVRNQGAPRTHRVVVLGEDDTALMVVTRLNKAAADLLCHRLNSCSGCALHALGHVPDHDGLARCETKQSIKSGGKLAHCNCGACGGRE